MAVLSVAPSGSLVAAGAGGGGGGGSSSSSSKSRYSRVMDSSSDKSAAMPGGPSHSSPVSSAMGSSGSCEERAAGSCSEPCSGSPGVTWASPIVISSAFLRLTGPLDGNEEGRLRLRRCFGAGADGDPPRLVERERPELDDGVSGDPPHDHVYQPSP